MDTFIKDLRYALRSFRRQPGFTVVTILTLALGIGANTAVFSVLNGVVLRPLPYPQPDRLAFVTSQFPNLGFNQFWISLPEFVEYRDHNRAFASVGAYTVGAVNLGTDPPSRPVRAIVTAELMPTLGVKPLAGRWFTNEDTAPKAEPVAILSWELWHRAYGESRALLGQTIQISDVATRVVGVMPRGFDVHDQKVEMWEPLTIDPATFANTRSNHFLYLVGRLRPEISLTQARADLDLLIEQWHTMVPTGHVPSSPQHRFRIDPLKEDIIGQVRTALIVLQAAVGFVLLIACANLANLLIARADSRMKEYAVRAALGASRQRLLRQLVTEGLVLASGGAVAGVALAWGGLSLLLSINADALPRTAEATLDWSVLAFTLAIAVVTGVIFGLVPLLHLGYDSIGLSMKNSGTRSSTGSVRARLRSALVVGEVALAVLLVVGAGLLIRSFFNLTRVDVGFDRSQLTTFGFVLPGGRYDAPARVAFAQRLTAAVTAVPGVQSAAVMTGLPPLRNVNANDTDFEHIPNNRPMGEGPAENVDYYQTVSAGYVETMGIPVVKGRGFEPGDVAGPPVAMVNEALAKRFFTDRDPIGQHVKPGFGDRLPWFTIVGVLKDVKQGGIAAQAGTELYLLMDQLPKAAGFAPGSLNLVVRSTRAVDTLAPTLRQTVASLDPSLPLVKMRSMDDVMGEAIARPRFLTLLLGLFAGLALVLAAVGTYGILSYLVSERKQEIGIRMALGADRGTILRLVLARGLWLSGAGVLIGLIASAGLTRVIATMLFNVTPTDPLTLAAVAGVMSVVAALACIVPAWRATRVDPLIVLREG
jgi:putative ABC transport system permease protein